MCGHGIDFELERERLLDMIPKAIVENDLMIEVTPSRSRLSDDKLWNGV